MKLRKLFIIAVLMFIIVFSSIQVFAESAKEAVRALKKLEAHIETGISLRDYSLALGDVKFEVNLFLESKDASNNLQLTELIKKIMSEYEDGKIIFKAKRRGNYRYIDRIPEPSSSYSNLPAGLKKLMEDRRKLEEQENQYYLTLLSKYPVSNKPINEGGAIGRDVSDIGKEKAKYGRVLELDKLLLIILNQASLDLKEATKLLASE
ncbi:MAG: hypothetical protein AB1401_05265 [Thermodesulfobacteriota bacterium]